MTDANYIHVHQKCTKCGGCSLECEHRVQWTSASTSSASADADRPTPEMTQRKKIEELAERVEGLEGDVAVFKALLSPPKGFISWEQFDNACRQARKRQQASLKGEEV